MELKDKSIYRKRIKNGVLPGFIGGYIPKPQLNAKINDFKLGLQSQEILDDGIKARTAGNLNSSMPKAGMYAAIAQKGLENIMSYMSSSTPKYSAEEIYNNAGSTTGMIDGVSYQLKNNIRESDYVKDYTAADAISDITNLNIGGALGSIFGRNKQIDEVREALRKRVAFNEQNRLSASDQARYIENIQKYGNLSEGISYLFNGTSSFNPSNRLNQKRKSFTPTGEYEVKPNARVNKGERIDRRDKYGNLIASNFVTRGPNDGAYASLKSGDIVWTAKRNPETGNPISQDVDLYESNGQLNRLMAIQDIMDNSKNNKGIYAAKCGKLPKYEDGLPSSDLENKKKNNNLINWWEVALPRLANIGNAYANYLSTKKEPINYEVNYQPNTYAGAAFSLLGQNKIDPTSILRKINDLHIASNYNIERSGGYSVGLKMKLKALNDLNSKNAYADALFNIQNQHNQYRSQLAQAMLTEGARDAQNKMSSLETARVMRDKAHGQKTKMLSEYQNNIYGNVDKLINDLINTRTLNWMYKNYAA